MAELRTRGIDPDDFCILWGGAHNSRGYPVIQLNGKTQYVTRVLTDCPPNMQVDHLCREKSCINTEHLEIVTPRENVLRGLLPKGNSPCIRCGGTDFFQKKEAQGGLGRRCKACHLRARRELYHKKRSNS